jgi:hypothetical protein
MRATFVPLAVSRSCPSCHKWVDWVWHYCPWCGAMLGFGLSGSRNAMLP